MRRDSRSAAAEAPDEGVGAVRPAADLTEERPHEDHPDKASGLGDLKRPSWTFAFKNALREFGDDECTDKAAALTYYAVLSLFPALIALLSLLGVVGQGSSAIDTIKQVLRPLVGARAISPQGQIGQVLDSLSTGQGAGLALVIGLLAALWSASGYVGAFGRAMNTVYEVSEGRPVWKLRPVLLLVTLVTILLSAVSLVILVVSGPVAESVGNVVGLGKTALLVWSIAKWPVLAVIVVVIVGLLYWATPNVRQPRFRWISVGAFIAIVVWVLGSALFALYLATAASYSKTYGAMAGVVVFLLWLWLTNLALLFGAEIDAELERSRELQAGMAAEEAIQLPLRDNRGVIKSEKKQAKAVAKAVALRNRFTHGGSIEDRPFHRN